MYCSNQNSKNRNWASKESCSMPCLAQIITSICLITIFLHNWNFKCTLYKANFSANWRCNLTSCNSPPDSFERVLCVCVYLSRMCSMIQWTDLQNLSLAEKQPNRTTAGFIAGHHPCWFLNSSITGFLQPPTALIFCQIDQVAYPLHQTNKTSRKGIWLEKYQTM